MVKVENDKTIQALTKRFIKSYKKNTITILLAVTLIITLIVSLLTLFHTNHRIEAKQNLFIYTDIDYQISNLKNSQLRELEGDKAIAKLGIRRFQATIKNDYQSAALVSANEPSILATSKLLSGAMPTAENEIVAEKWALLNLGINPVVGTDVQLETIATESTDSELKTYTIVGIINDVSLNKLSGSLNLYTSLNEDVADDYYAEVKFKNNVDSRQIIQNKKKHLGIAQKDISLNPWKENKQELLILDIQITTLLLIICFVIIWGIYRISLLARENQYGILRAVGVTKRQIRKMIVSELLVIYVISIPLGIIFGQLCSYLVTYISKNNESDIFFWGEREPFEMVVPILPIILCIAGVGVVLFIISLLGARKINKQTIMEVIIGEKEDDNKNTAVFTISDKSERFLYVKLGCRYIFAKFRTSIVIVVSLIIGGSLFYGLAYKGILASHETVIQKEANFYNSDYILTATNDRTANQGITIETVKQAQQIEEIVKTETQMAMPIKVLNDETKRNNKYFEEMEKRVENIYGFSLRGKLGSNSIYQTKLKGYNTETLKKLKNYLVVGNFNPDNMEANEIIIAMPRISEYGKSKGTVGFFKKGTAIMDYQLGQTIKISYRSDFDTTSNKYWQSEDDEQYYSKLDYKIVAIVYYPYMKEVSVLEQVYPLLITSETNYSKINPSGVYETANFTVKDSSSKKRKEEIEQELIRLAVKNQQVTARSLIEENSKLDMLYQKELVYIYGIAVVAFTLLLINLVNSLKYRVETRKRELYIYRAIGMSLHSQSKMIQIENMIFGLVSVGIVFLASHAIAQFLYVESEIYIYGQSYEYDYFIYLLLAAAILVICYVVSILLNRRLKDESILNELNKIE
ncbi:ABC transporter permease [Enterococcus sp. LJL128]